MSDYDLRTLTTNPVYVGTLGPRLERMIADAREHGMTPQEFRYPPAFYDELVGRWGEDLDTHGLPVRRGHCDRVVLICDRGDVSFNLVGWDVGT